MANIGGIIGGVVFAEANYVIAGNIPKPRISLRLDTGESVTVSGKE